MACGETRETITFGRATCLALINVDVDADKMVVRCTEPGQGGNGGIPLAADNMNGYPTSADKCS